MIVHKISSLNFSNAEELDNAFESTEPQKVKYCNWAKEFPYAPNVEFRIFHTGDFLFIRFYVQEECTAAIIKNDNGNVWTDSCVEFFISPDEGKSYYNFETTCIGRMLLAHHLSREEAEYASTEILASVKRTPSLPRQNFQEICGDNRWTLTLQIPPKALFKHQITTWDNTEASANFYKCGDNLSRQHFLSWAPIDTEKPDFHRPDFFQPLKFE